MKLMSSPQEIMLFAKWGYPLWFMYLTGVWDILFAIGLNIKQTSRISAIGLILLLCTDVVTPPC